MHSPRTFVARNSNSGLLRNPHRCADEISKCLKRNLLTRELIKSQNDTSEFLMQASRVGKREVGDGSGELPHTYTRIQVGTHVRSSHAWKSSENVVSLFLTAVDKPCDNIAAGLFLSVSLSLLSNRETRVVVDDRASERVREYV